MADDHALFRDGFALLLQQHEADMQCSVAGSLDAALDLLRAVPDTDLLMLDLHMPGMHGAQSIQMLQQQYPGLPVIILSAEESRSQMEALLAAGVAGYIPKASSAAVMISAIRLVLAGGVYVPSQMLNNDAGTDARRIASTGDVHFTERQQQVLHLLARGLPNKAICRELEMGEGTLKAHLNAIYRALSVNNRTEAAMKAQRFGLTR
jgi:DNA-binding NarL/FixJ family response regulator